MQLIAERMRNAPEVRELEPQDHIRVSNESAAAIALVQGMTRGEIHASPLIDDRRL